MLFLAYLTPLCDQLPILTNYEKKYTPTGDRGWKLIIVRGKLAGWKWKLAI